MAIFGQFPIATVLLHIQSNGFTCTLISILLLINQISSASGEESNRKLNPNQRVSLSRKVLKNANSIGDTVPYQTSSKSSYSKNELKLDHSTHDANEDEIIGIEDHQLAQLDANTHVYTNQFVIESKEGPEHVKKLALDHGFEYLGHIFDNFYHLKHRKIAKRSVDNAHHNHHAPLSSHPSVVSLQQQKLKRRTKRDFLTPPNKNKTKKQVLPYYSATHHRHFQEQKTPLLPFSREFAVLPNETSFDNRIKFDDPQWPRMWYLNRGNGLDMNVEGAWAKNVTGRDIVVTILDDGLEKDHPDLVTNYDPKASTDVNGLDEDPMPRYDIIDSNRHGTRCAGEVAANANNSVCAVGVAFNAKVGGIRMLDGDVTDAVEARSLSFNPDHIDVYSASWGPDDDGRTVDGPGELAAKAFENGIIKGRKGKGSIFVWASGNGGREKDNCNCDGYTNSIWTLSISSATEKGSIPWYSEACSSTLATTYSSGSFGERQIVTTDLHHGCTASHTGTSASAPLAAGICALALEANRKLTWRDMQHIVVLTAKQKNLHDKDWVTNGVGRNVSHWFGYGLLDASAMVDYSREWTTVPEQTKCEMRFKVDKDGYIHPGKSEKFRGPEPVKCAEVLYLEHIQVKVNLTAHKRGDIEIKLTSPAGTTSTLLAVRPMDNSRMGFANWPFMTVHTWGEQPNGHWQLTVINHGRSNLAVLHEWTLVMYGTGKNPYSESFVKKFNVRQTHPKPSSLVTSTFDIPTTPSTPTKVPIRPYSSLPKEPSKHLSDNRIDHGSESSTSSSAKNQTKVIFVVPSNNRNSSSSSAYPPLSKVHSDTKLFPSELPNVKQKIDDYGQDYGQDEEDEERPANTPNRRPYHPHPGRHHSHYLPSVDRQTDQLHKFYSPHHPNRYPALVSSSSPLVGLGGLSFFGCHFLLLAIACAFTATVLQF